MTITPDDYVPTYIPYGLLIASGFGHNTVINNLYSLQPSSAQALKQVLAQMGYKVDVFATVSPFPNETGYTFSFNTEWIALPATPGLPKGKSRAKVNAGLYANYFNMGVRPFIVTEYEKALRAVIVYRQAMAEQGIPKV